MWKVYFSLNALLKCWWGFFSCFFRRDGFIFSLDSVWNERKTLATQKQRKQHGFVPKVKRTQFWRDAERFAQRCFISESFRVERYGPGLCTLFSGCFGLFCVVFGFFFLLCAVTLCMLKVFLLILFIIHYGWEVRSERERERCRWCLSTNRNACIISYNIIEWYNGWRDYIVLCLHLRCSSFVCQFVVVVVLLLFSWLACDKRAKLKWKYHFSWGGVWTLNRYELCS